jgi:hypothetical protein
MKIVTTPADWQVYITQILTACVNSICNVGIYRTPSAIHQTYLHSRYESSFNKIKKYLVNKSVCEFVCCQNQMSLFKMCQCVGEVFKSLFTRCHIKYKFWLFPQKYAINGNAWNEQFHMGDWHTHPARHLL